jgi:hypothetical protein
MGHGILTESNLVLIVLPLASVLWTVAYLNIRVKYEGLSATRLSKDLGVVGPVEDTIHEFSVENDVLETTILHDKFDNMRNANSTFVQRS